MPVSLTIILELLEDFFDRHISRLEKMTEYGIFFQKGMPSKALQNLYGPNPVANRKSSRNIFYMMGSDTTTHKLFILSIRKIIRTDKMEFDHIAFVELFMAHLSKTKFKVLSFT